MRTIPISLSLNKKKGILKIKKNDKEKLLFIPEDKIGRVYAVITEYNLYIFTKEISSENFIAKIFISNLEKVEISNPYIKIVEDNIKKEKKITIERSEPIEFCCKTITGCKLYITYKEPRILFNKLFKHYKNINQYRIIITSENKLFITSYLTGEMHDLTEFFKRLFDWKEYTFDSFYFSVMQELIILDFNVNSFKLLATLKKREEEEKLKSQNWSAFA